MNQGFILRWEDRIRLNKEGLEEVNEVLDDPKGFYPTELIDEWEAITTDTV